MLGIFHFTIQRKSDKIWLGITFAEQASAQTGSLTSMGNWDNDGRSQRCNKRDRSWWASQANCIILRAAGPRNFLLVSSLRIFLRSFDTIGHWRKRRMSGDGQSNLLVYWHRLPILWKRWVVLVEPWTIVRWLENRPDDGIIAQTWKSLAVFHHDVMHTRSRRARLHSIEKQHC